MGGSRPRLSVWLIAAVIAAARPSGACAPAWGGDQAVQIAGEEALIVWDAARGIEHFVRTATFQGGPRSFGFLVPVPALPEISAADEQIFEQMERFWESSRPEEVHTRFEGLTSFFMRSKSAAPVSGAAGVTVLSATRVAGMDAVVLEAASTKALRDWLTAREFDFRPELESWVEPYVAERFKIVAFKYARDTSDQRIGARAVRLSFRTPEPFFPYREPRDAERLVPALFRLYVIAHTSVEGLLGEARSPWTAQVRYSGPFTPEPPAFARIASPWITMFEEVAQKRPVAGDLYLRPTSTHRPIAAPPRTVERRWGVPIELLVAGLLVAGVVLLLVVRRGRSPGARPP
jgi:hypothetical protein